MSTMSDDLISKQLVIDIIEQHKKIVLGEREWHEGIAWGYATAHRHLVDVVKQLPSTQPEIIRCKDCRYANECHKSVQYTRNEPNSTIIGYSAIKWCSRGERREDDE